MNGNHEDVNMPETKPVVNPPALSPTPPPSTVSARSVMLCTRIHRRNADELDLSPLVKFLDRARGLTRYIAVAVDGSDKLLVECARGIVEGKHTNISLLILPVWGQVVPALNSLLAHAMELKATHILYASVELEFGPGLIEQLGAHFTPETLVVGAALEGHHFSEGTHVIDGCTTPWNTCALWDVKKLGLAGFLGVADGSGDIPAGVEEVTTISLLQQQLPECMEAKLARCSGILWVTDWSDPMRRDSHQRKMETKLSRAAGQMALLRLRPAKVQHIENPLSPHPNAIPHSPVHH